MTLGDQLTKLRASATTRSVESDEAGQPSARNGETPLPEYAAEEIFRGSRIVKIRHAGQEYRLLITRNNRLILQK